VIDIEEAAKRAHARLQEDNGLTRDQLFAQAVEELKRCPALLQLALDVNAQVLFRALVKRAALVLYVTQDGFCDTLTNIKRFVGVSGYSSAYNHLREFLNEMVRTGLLGRARGPHGCSVYHDPALDPAGAATSGAFAEICDRVFAPRPGGQFKWRGRECTAERCPGCGAPLKRVAWEREGVLELACTRGCRAVLDFGERKVLFKRVSSF